MMAKGFNCKTCGKPLFVVVDDVDALLDCKAEIRSYQRRGYELVDIPEVSVDGDWCDCKRKRKTA